MTQCENLDECDADGGAINNMSSFREVILGAQRAFDLVTNRG